MTKNKVAMLTLISVIFLCNKLKERRQREMDIVYATLIIHGYRKFKDVPLVLKDRVKNTLTNLGFPELAVEE